MWNDNQNAYAAERVNEDGETFYRFWSVDEEGGKWELGCATERVQEEGTEDECRWFEGRFDTKPISFDNEDDLTRWGKKHSAEFVIMDSADFADAMRELYVFDVAGSNIDFAAAVNIMDDDLREEVAADIAPCSDQEFFDEYSRRHADKFGEGFAPYVGAAW